MSVTDASVLDEAVRRFPVLISTMRVLASHGIDVSQCFFLSDDVVSAVRSEYRRILAERAKGRVSQ